MDETREITDDQLKKIAVHLADALEEKRAGCAFTAEEQRDLRSLLRTKKRAASAVLWASGAVILWILKDVYGWILKHLTWSGA